MRKISGVLISAMLAIGAASQIQAQDDYPNRPIAYVIPSAPGGGADLGGRMIAAALSEALGQPVVVENRGGGGGSTGIATVANAAPDGYTIGQIANSNYAIHPHLATLPYDVFDDLRPVGLAIGIFHALLARADFPADSIQHLVDYAKENPGLVTYASTGPGSIGHLYGMALSTAAGIELVHVPYSGTSSALTDLFAGRVDLLFDSAPVERIASGQAKGIAAIRTERIVWLPDLPTIFETLPSFPIGSFGNPGWGIVAPAGTPDEIISKLSDAILSMSEDEDYIARVETIGFGVSPLSSEDFSEQMRRENEEYGNFIRQSEITLGN